jgi:hypothetical protein
MKAIGPRTYLVRTVGVNEVSDLCRELCLPVDGAISFDLHLGGTDQEHMLPYFGQTSVSTPRY